MENTTVEYRKTATGRPTVVGTRRCSDPTCDVPGGRHEFHTKKYEKSLKEEDLNERYSLCKGVCVYCYNKKRNKSAGTSLTEEALTAKIKYYQDLLKNKQQAEAPTA